MTERISSMACIVCGHSARVCRSEEYVEFVCIDCGQFRVSDDAIGDLRTLTPPAREEILIRAAFDVESNSMPIISVYSFE